MDSGLIFSTQETEYSAPVWTEEIPLFHQQVTGTEPLVHTVISDRSAQARILNPYFKKAHDIEYIDPLKGENV
jgi:hypothetical protein